MTPHDAMFVQIHAIGVLFNRCKRHPKVTDEMVRESGLVCMEEGAMILLMEPSAYRPEDVAGYTMKIPSDPTSH